MLFTLVPRDKVFEMDEAYKKLTGDARTSYIYTRYQELGYLTYLRVADMCEGSEDYDACLVRDTDANKAVVAEYESQGYTVDFLRSGDAYAVKDKSALEILWFYYSNMFQFDSKNYVQDENNPDLVRGYSIETAPNGLPAVVCSGCQYKYQWYLNGSFPFIHSNWMHLNFGNSFPTMQGTPTMQVISVGQGSKAPVEQTFPTGLTEENAINQFTCQYKAQTDRLDAKRFTDNYANCLSYFESPSMINTSYFFGICALIIAYGIGLPAGITMARKKGKLADKIGIVVINFLIAVPSLALIFFVRQIGNTFGFPDRFPILGFSSWKSYVIPIIILALLNMPSLMTWVRRYMIDQSNSDYAKFAKAKGLSQKEISRNHILKNAIIPIVNGIPSSIILCISGALITESAFAIPGMGKMLPDAIKQSNNNMVINLVFIFTTLSVFSILAGDILMTWVDPRISLNAKGGE